MKILDCTLRDGGYYTNWDFDRNLVDTYIESFNQLPVDYLEIGYRSKPLKGYFGEYFYCPIHVMERLKNQSNKDLVLILNEKDIAAKDAEEVLSAAKPYIKMIRLAVDPANFDRALLLGEAVKKMGFELAFNVMYMSNWSQHPSLIQGVKNLEGMVDYLYMVDSFGGVYPEDVIKTIDLIKSKSKVPLGFHGHNNLELGLINTLTAIEHGVEIIDSTITGMGRGAGNLKTELLLTVLNAKGIIDFDFNALSKVTDGFQKLQKAHDWGTNLPYMVSGAYSLPQKQVMEWVTKRFFSFNSILRALSNQSKGLKDNKQLPNIKFNKNEKLSTAVIIGGGPTAVKHAEAIKKFIVNENAVVIHASARNAMSYTEIDNEQIFCLIGNEGHRLEEVFDDVNKVKGKCVLPPYPRKMGTYIPKNLEKRAFELQKVDFTDVLQDTHLALALQTAIELGVCKIYFVGYDGYTGFNMGQKERDVFYENEILFRKFSNEKFKLISLTYTSYENLEMESIFGLIK